jgi:phosphotransferase system enzyme I (PtsP)
MLDVLHRIVQEVNAAPDLGEALRLIVTGVKDAIGADVCSVYLTDFDSREHVLQATEGLKQEAVGEVRLPWHRGLVGLVCERAESLNLDDAPAHPRYLFMAETGEKRYHGFLGVPIIQHRRVLGVLVVRQLAPRRFDDDEVTFLFTLAAQLAGAITHARASGELASIQGQGVARARFLDGRAGAAGVAVGTAVVVYPLSDLAAVPDRVPEDPVREAEAFRAAVAAVKRDLQALESQVEASLPAEDRALFDAWLLMLGSDSLVDRVVELIHGGNWAAGALHQTIEEHARVFDAMDDVYLRERASDIRDLGRRILMHLQEDEKVLVVYPEDSVLVGEDVSAMQLAEVPRECLAGVVSARGSASSHVAILARAMGVPAVMGVRDLPVGRMEGRSVVVDGYRGRVHISPDHSVLAAYRQVIDADRALSEELDGLRRLPAETTDGARIPLYLNTGLMAEIDALNPAEVDGVGLYRTELPFMVRDRFPGEDEQAQGYRRILDAFVPKPVALRTLDIGGDKPLSYFPIEESNPFLGWRGIRVSLDHPEIFLTQLRAMLRAAIGLGNLRLLLPMVSSLGEVDEALLLVRRAYDELHEEGLHVGMPSIGVMVEVPSMVYQTEELARRVDFLSVGTNDLTQYLLAVDRNNPNVADLYDDMHPAVLRALTRIVEGARCYDREVGVCGEMAGDPAAAVLLIGMGVHSLSMSASSLLRVKWAVRSFSSQRARELVQVALGCEDGRAVRRLMSAALEKAGLGGLVRPGK